MDKKMMIMVGLACAGVAALGVILPWVSATTPMGSETANGFNENLNGTFVFILCLIAAGGFLVHFLGKSDAIPLKEQVFFFIVCGVAGLATLLTVLDFFDDAFRSITIQGKTFSVSRGIGLILSLLGCIGATVMGVMIALKAKE